jgi:hypothetical protein
MPIPDDIEFQIAQPPERSTITLSAFENGTMLRADGRTKEGRAQKLALAVGLIEPHGPNRYRLTRAGRSSLAATTSASTAGSTTSIANSGMTKSSDCAGSDTARGVMRDDVGPLAQQPIGHLAVDRRHRVADLRRS